MEALDGCLAQYENTEASEVEFVQPKIGERFGG
jgi:hypothetical protein